MEVDKLEALIKANKYYFIINTSKNIFFCDEIFTAKLYNIDNEKNVDVLILESGVKKKVNLNRFKDCVSREAEITSEIIDVFKLKPQNQDIACFENFIFEGYYGEIFIFNRDKLLDINDLFLEGEYSLINKEIDNKIIMSFEKTCK